MRGAWFMGQTVLPRTPDCILVCSVNIINLQMITFGHRTTKQFNKNDFRSHHQPSDACNYSPNIILGMFIPAVFQIKLPITGKHWMGAIKSKLHRCSIAHQTSQFVLSHCSLFSAFTVFVRCSYQNNLKFMLSICDWDNRSGENRHFIKSRHWFGDHECLRGNRE